MANPACGSPKEIRQDILVLNGGSSSIKFAFFDTNLSCLVHGSVNRIGTKDAAIVVEGAAAQAIPAGNTDAAAAFLAGWVRTRLGSDPIAGIGHRLVHGGPRYSEPTRVDPAMIRTLRTLTAFDPDHLPGELALIEAFQAGFPQASHVACFDTAFHRTMPRVAQLLAIPRSYFNAGVRRYGFHGLSYEYLMGELARVAGTAANGRVVLAHLGSGASIAALKDGKPVDTSMGFTPAAGLPMATRSGDLDPGLAGYLGQSDGFDSARFNRFVNTECGLLGISGTTGDMRDLQNLESSDPRAAEAVDFFCYQTRKAIGAYAAALGGIETLVFSGGIGENSAAVRSRICEGLGFLGIEVAAAANTAHAAVVSAAASRVCVRVIPTNEALVIARSTRRVLGLVPPDGG